jgi:2-dehydropantoate 2-reductase
LRVKVFDDIDQLVREKLVCNCSLSGPCAVSDMTTGEVMADPDMARISAACATEAFDVAAPVNDAITALAHAKERQLQCSS